MDLLYKEEVYAIVGAAMEVYNHLGPGFLEAVYQESLAIEFRRRKIPFREQAAISIFYKSQPLRQHYIPDFIAYNKVIIEIKAIKQLSSVEEAQLINYLKASKMALGLLINFGNPQKLEWQRKILSTNIREQTKN